MPESNSFITSITNILQYTSSIAIGLNKSFFGIDCQIYYPKESKVNNEYAGRHDDLEYNQDPDTEARLLVPDIYNTRRTPLAGVQDTLFQDTYVLYAEHDLYLPYLTKIVTNSDKLGCYSFLVRDDDTVTTPIDKIYREVTLVPFVSYRNNDSDIDSNTQDLVDEWNEAIDDMEAIDNYGVSENNSKPPIPIYKYNKIK